jgi:Mn2+-dependent serine/threonine protein kinase
MKIEVIGHSGCSVDVKRIENRLFIQKQTTDPTYIDRLYRQAQKQITASKEEYQNIKIPRIYECNKNDARCSILMEYIYSKNFVEYFESAGFEQIDNFIHSTIHFLEKEIRSSPVQSIATDLLLNKFDSVRRTIEENQALNKDETVATILQLSEKHFKSLNPTITLPVGTCHGDLTFSNILFNGTNYYLIDFLDSFIESPLLDMVKIRQDSYYLWSVLMFQGKYDNTRLNIVSKKIDSELDSYFRKYEWYNKYYNLFQLMNFLRILQYANQENVIIYLKKVLTNLANE